MADRARLESVCTPKGVPGVRIPPSPPVLNFRRFSATTDHGRGKRTCNTGSVFEPSDRKTLTARPRLDDGRHVRRKDRDELRPSPDAAAATVTPSAERREIALFSSILGLSTAFQCREKSAERAAEPPRGPAIGSGRGIRSDSALTRAPASVRLGLLTVRRHGPAAAGQNRRRKNQI